MQRMIETLQVDIYSKQKSKSPTSLSHGRPSLSVGCVDLVDRSSVLCNRDLLSLVASVPVGIWLVELSVSGFGGGQVAKCIVPMYTCERGGLTLSPRLLKLRCIKNCRSNSLWNVSGKDCQRMQIAATPKLQQRSQPLIWLAKKVPKARRTMHNRDRQRTDFLMSASPSLSSVCILSNALRVLPFKRCVINPQYLRLPQVVTKAQHAR